MKKLLFILCLVFLVACNADFPVQDGFIIDSASTTPWGTKFHAYPIKGAGSLYFIDKPNSFNIGDTIWFQKNKIL